MRLWVNEWVQEGRLYVWRYANPNRDWSGWHFAADPPGCRSIRNLLDRMEGGDASHRTLRLERVTDAILGVPNYGRKSAGQFSRLRVAYGPEVKDLRLSAEGDLLTMAVGGPRQRKLAAAFAEVETGGGDFGLRLCDDRRAETWMFWCMPDVDYRSGRRS